MPRFSNHGNCQIVKLRCFQLLSVVICYTAIGNYSIQLNLDWYSRSLLQRVLNAQLLSESFSGQQEPLKVLEQKGSLISTVHSGEWFAGIRKER